MPLYMSPTRNQALLIVSLGYAQSTITKASVHSRAMVGVGINRAGVSATRHRRKENSSAKCNGSYKAVENGHHA